MHGYMFKSDRIRTVHKLQHIMREFEIPITIEL